MRTLLAETDETDTTTRSFTSGTAGANSEYGDLVSEYDAQSLEEVFPQYDAQWSTRELIGDGCDVVARFRNTAFGLASPASSPSWSDLSSAQWSVMGVEDWNHLPVMDSGGPFGFWRPKRVLL